MIPLFDWPAQRQNASKIVLQIIPNCFKISRIWRKILILPFVWYAPWSKSSMITTTSRLFPTDLMFLKIPICPLTWHLMTSFLSLLFCDWSILVPIIWPKGLSRLYGNPSFWPRFSHFQKFQLYKWFSTFWRQKEIYYSPVTIHYHYSSVAIHDTVHSEFLPI